MVEPEELRELLERTLEQLEGDERRGPLLQATGLRMRFDIVDAALVLDVWASDRPDRRLEWSFEPDPGFDPQLELEMDSEVANGYLQGQVSLAVAIARRRVRCRGDSRATICLLPSVRLLAEHYRQLVSRDYPHLAVGASG